MSNAEWNSGNRIQQVKIKYLGSDLKILDIRSKDQKRRLRRKKINEIKDTLEKMSLADIERIDRMIKAMLNNPSAIESISYKIKERRK